MIPRAAVFIDGAYLEWIVMREPGVARLRMHDLIPHMAGPTELFRAYWYDCLPAVTGVGEMTNLVRKEKFLNYLRALPRVEVRLGKMGRKDGADGGASFVQKGVDVSLAVDLVALATQRAISHAHILTGDNDFAPAVRYAKANGVAVKLWYGGRGRPGHDLFDACDDRVELRLADFKADVKEGV